MNKVINNRAWILLWQTRKNSALNMKFPPLGNSCFRNSLTKLMALSTNAQLRKDSRVWTEKNTKSRPS